MTKPYQVGLLFAFSFIIVKMIAYFSGIWLLEMKPFAMINMLFLLAAIAMGLYRYLKNDSVKGEDFMKEIKKAMQAGIVYTIVVSGFLFIYYNNIHTEFFSTIKKEQLDTLQKAIDNPVLLANMRRTNGALELMEPQEMLQERKKQLDQFMSPSFTVVITLMGMMLLSILYSIMTTLIFRKILFRNRI